MSIKKLFITVFTCFLILLAMIALVSMRIIKQNELLNKSQENRYLSFVAADELRQSSADLTRLARTYISTGDSKYEDMYWEVVDIRAGKKARPDGRTISLRQIMEDLGFTEAELRKLDLASEKSQELVWTETIAMNAVKGIFHDENNEFTIHGEPDLDLARDLMFNQQYHDYVTEIMKPIDEFFVMLDSRSAKAVQDNKDLSDRYLSIVVLLIVVLAVTTIIAYILIDRKVNVPVKKLIKEVKLIAEGDFSGKIQSKSKDEIGQLYVSIFDMKEKIFELIEDINNLSIEATNGKLGTRILVDKYYGEYQTIAQGLNATLDALIDPMMMMAEYLDRISKGDMPPFITAEYKGDFMEVKTNINLCIESIKALVDDSNMLSEAALAGDLDRRVEVYKHNGDYRKIIHGINSTLDAIINPINVASENISKISEGTIPPQIEEEYFGDFNKLKNSINNLIGNLDDFVSEVDYMSREQEAGDIDAFINEERFVGVYRTMSHKVNTAVRDQINVVLKVLGVIRAYSENDFDTVLDKLPGKRVIANEYLDKLRSDFVNMIDAINKIIDNISKGNLDYRENSDRHSGTYKGIIDGFNETLDTLISQIKLTSDYNESLSRGELPERITEEVEGDFNISKNSINKLIDTFECFINEMNNMAESHEYGKLSVRMDAPNYEGSFEEMALGVNNMVESHIQPMYKVIEVIEAFGRGDFNVEMASLPGDKALLKVAIDRVKDGLSDFSTELNELIEAANQGILGDRGDAEKFEGGWSDLVSGLNSLLDAIVEPINEADVVLNNMSQGDLTSKMQGEYLGQFSGLKNNINKLSESLIEMVSKVNETVVTTSASASEISATSETLAAAAQEMNSQADDVAAAVEQMARTVSENAQGATKTSALAMENAHIAEEGGEVVRETVQKMGDIAKVVEETATNIEKLGASSQAIGEIVSVIDDIADQTNLLALNASIEAARAGEQGRGFAVVADEVRKLAEKTVEATKEIASQITGIQKETELAVQAMNQGTKEVESGMQLAQRAGAALEKVLSSSNEVTDMITDIAAASEEQAATTEQISKNVVGISQATADSTHQVEDVAHVSEELTYLTNELNTMMGQFKVKTESLMESSEEDPKTHEINCEE